MESSPRLAARLVGRRRVPMIGLFGESFPGSVPVTARLQAGFFLTSIWAADRYLAMAPFFPMVNGRYEVRLIFGLTIKRRLVSKSQA